MKVFYGSQQGCAHLSLECLEKAMNFQHSLNDVIEVDVDGTEALNYCRRCCPQVLWSPDVLHPRCPTCGQARSHPCRHSGVKIMHRSQNGQTFYPMRWPEKVRAAPVAELPEGS